MGPSLETTISQLADLGRRFARRWSPTPSSNPWTTAELRRGSHRP